MAPHQSALTVKVLFRNNSINSLMMPENPCCFGFLLDPRTQAQSTRPPVPGDKRKSPQLKLHWLPHRHPHKTATQRRAGSGFVSMSHVCSAFVVSSDCTLVCLQARWPACRLSDCHDHGEELLTAAISLFSSFLTACIISICIVWCVFFVFVTEPIIFLIFGENKW